MDKWANFLANEKLHPKYTDEESVMLLIHLCEVMASKRGPLIRPYKQKLISRRFVAETALDLGIDLMEIRHKFSGKSLIGRGLLDVWLVAYKERYGSTVGTRAEWESKRRDCKMRLRDVKSRTSESQTNSGSGQCSGEQVQ